MVLDHFFRPEPAAHVERFVDASTPCCEVELHRVPLFLEPARADAELDPPTREHVERCDGASAVMNGWRSPMLYTCVPSRIVDVDAATIASETHTS